MDTMSDSYSDHLDSLAAAAVEALESYANNERYDAHDALSEVAFDTADECMRNHSSGQDAISLIEMSDNEPEEWQPYAEGKSDWEEVVSAMAFTVVRQDVYDALEKQGYLDEYWNPTEKLEAMF